MSRPTAIAVIVTAMIMKVMRSTMTFILSRLARGHASAFARNALPRPLGLL